MGEGMFFNDARKKSIRELRAIYKEYPEWFEVPESKSVAGKTKWIIRLDNH